MKRRAIHPLLVAVFPVVFLFAQNVEYVRPGKIAWPVAAVVVGTIIIFAVARILLGDLRRAALATSLWVLLFMSYGHVWSLVGGRSVAGIPVGRDLVLLPLWLVLAVGGYFIARRVRSLDEWTQILNITSFALLGFAVFSAGQAMAANSAPALTSPGSKSGALPQVGDTDRARRDVYYLIFDRYGRQDVIDRFYGYDNGPFVSALRSKGFYVADRSNANYPKTAHSLAASLSMDYLDHLSREPGEASSDWKPLFRMLSGSKVERFFKQQGYRSVHIGGWWGPTASDQHAHVNYRYTRRSEFSRILAQTTLIQPAAKRLGVLSDLDFRRQTYNEALFQFESVRDASKLPGPKFVFAHFLIPHEPFRFDRNGRYVTEDEQRAQKYQQNYVDQLIFTNKQIEQLLDGLMDVPEDRRPIILVQSDEGPQPGGVDWGGGRTRWTLANDDQLRTKFSILNAYYLPKVGQGPLYPSITPVNSFRFLLNQYFDTNLKLLPDRSYIYADVPTPYVFHDVTDRVK